MDTSGGIDNTSSPHRQCLPALPPESSVLLAVRCLSGRMSKAAITRHTNFWRSPDSVQAQAPHRALLPAGREPLSSSYALHTLCLGSHNALRQMLLHFKAILVSHYKPLLAKGKHWVKQGTNPVRAPLSMSHPLIFPGHRNKPNCEQEEQLMIKVNGSCCQD